ncbi:MAG TPA: hypothetical protein VG870_10240 [Chitinophagaceae bacterium]|nr:hypothetical protein [Chitinophagaceae bacterium]
MKKLILLFLLSGGALLAKSQYTFYSTNYNEISKTSKEALSTSEQRQLYNISFADKIFIHNKFKPGEDEIEDSQIYQITDVEDLGEGITMFTTLSGVTGNSYQYILKVNESGESSLTQVMKDEDYNIRFNGTLTSLKTVKQNN